MTTPVPGGTCPQCNNPVPPSRPALCPKCQFPLLLVNGDDQFQATAREGLRRPTEKVVEAPEPPVQPPPPVTQTRPSPQPPPGPVRPCPRCGQPNAVTAAWCARCALSLRQPAPPPRMAPVPAQKKGSAGRVLLTIVILLALLAVAYYMWGDSEGLFDVSSLLTPWAQGWLAGGGR